MHNSHLPVALLTLAVDLTAEWGTMYRQVAQGKLPEETRRAYLGLASRVEGYTQRLKDLAELAGNETPAPADLPPPEGKPPESEGPPDPPVAAPPEGYVTPAQAARVAGVTLQTVCDLLRRGTLRGVKQGGKWLIPVAEAEGYYARRRHQAAEGGSATPLDHPPQKAEEKAESVSWPGYCSPGEAAQRLGLARPEVLALLGNGKLEGVEMGQVWLVSVAAVEAMAKGRQPAQERPASPDAAGPPPDGDENLLRPWRVIEDPEGSFRGCCFRWIDLQLSAKQRVWPAGIRFENSQTGEVAVFDGRDLRKQSTQPEATPPVPPKKRGRPRRWQTRPAGRSPDHPSC